MFQTASSEAAAWLASHGLERHAVRCWHTASHPYLWQGRLLSLKVVECGRGDPGEGVSGPRSDRGFRRPISCSDAEITLPPLSLLLVKWGKERRRGSGETSPYPRCLPASFPASSVTFAAVLWSRWVRELPGVGARPGTGEATALALSRAADDYAQRNMPPVTRNPSAAHSLLHLASIAHSSCDDKEVIPCHFGHNRPDHRRRHHRR